MDPNFITNPFLATQFPIKCSYLTDFSCAASPINDLFVKLLCKNCPNIIRLGLPETDITDQSISHIYKLIPKVEWLNFSNTNLTSSSLPIFIKFKKIEILSLSYCKKIVSPLPKFEVESDCPLSVLQMCWMSTELSSKCVKNFVKSFQKLKRLNLSNMKQLEEKHLLKILSRSQEYIENLNLSFLEKLTDNTLDFMENLNNMTYLTLAHNKNYTAKKISEMISRCSNLQRIELTSTLVDNSVLEVIKDCEQICYVGLRNTKVNYTVCKKFFQNYPHLSYSF